MPRMETLIPDGAWLVHELLRPEECAALIESAEREGFAAAPVTTSYGPVMIPDYRNNTRVMRDEPAVVDHLWPRVAPFVEQMGIGLPAIGLNERLRYYSYVPGEFFAPHGDGSFIRDLRERSLLTVLFYLNGDCEGGETRFLSSGVSVRPQTGLALFFVHPLLHEGRVVRAGRKLVLRSDVMFRLWD